MIHFLFLTTTISVLISCFSTVSAQKIMKLDGNLQASTEPMQAKRKGVGMVGKYQFGPYQIVSGKEGMTTTVSKSRFLSAQTESKSKKKLSFVFVRDGKDSVLVNASVNTDVRDWDWDRITGPMINGWTVLKESQENYLATFSFPSDSAIWRMVLFTKVGQDVKGKEGFVGVLTDGKEEIQIKEIKHWNDGKTAVMGVATGYEFYSQESVIAAVQSSLDTFQKKLVWISVNNNASVQLILAATSAAIMVKTDGDLADLDRH